MSLRDRLSVPQAATARRPRTQAPKGFEPGIRYEGAEATEVTLQLREIPEDEQRWREEITRVTSLPIPEHRKVELAQVRYWGAPEEPFIYCRFVITDREVDAPGLDVNDLIKTVKAVRRKSAPKSAGTDRGLVVAWADPQIGKVGSRGDSEDLVDRIMSKLDLLDDYAKQMLCDSAYFIDVGDGLEGFENVASQLHTNDLAFPTQQRLLRRLSTEAIIRLARHHSRVVGAVVPSNHCNWRRGKDQLGKPGDDFGVENMVAIADALALNPDAFGHVSFVIPNEWEETIALDVHGTILAVTHGHQVNRPDRIPDWWAKQVHGGQPASDADILLTGHFHTTRIQPTGRSSHTGRAKWWLGAPTLDNGSDWYRLKAGSDSDPALMVFTVDANGWDNLRLL